MDDDIHAVVELRIRTGSRRLIEVERVAVTGADPEGGEHFVLPPGGVSLDALEGDLIRQALERYQENRTRAARALGLTRQTLLYRMRKHGLR